ncbi:hypothetical protein [Microbacterium sp.]|uniref:hypothetical protein n=1 Tax=Microbacterium sp. TaxID=51671 RepID=UPI003C73C35E
MSPSQSPIEPPPALRRLRPDEAPYPGILRAGDPPMVWVRVDALPMEVWQVPLDSHILIPHDIARVDGGHMALLLPCDAPLARRVAGVPPTPGEAVTIAVSILRAATTAQSVGIETGTWWVDADGRPVLAAGGAAPWVDTALSVLAELAEDARGPLADALAEVVRALSAGPLIERDVERCEDLLFDAAEPAPLIRRLAPAAVEPMPRRARSLSSAADPHPKPTPLWYARFVDDDVVDRAAQGVRSVTGAATSVFAGMRRRRRPTDPPRRRPAVRPAHADRTVRPPRRRAPLIVAAAVGVITVAGGLALPHEEDPAEAVVPQSSDATASSPHVHIDDDSGAVETTAETTPTASPSEGSSGPAVRALAALDTCAREAPAICEVLEDPATPVPTGVASGGAADRTATLLDEYGGVAVYRVDAPDRPSQVLVLVTVDGKGLVRDVYDLADQP